MIIYEILLQNTTISRNDTTKATKQNGIISMKFTHAHEPYTFISYKKKQVSTHFSYFFGSLAYKTCLRFQKYISRFFSAKA